MSQGSRPIRDLSGQRFGYLLVIDLHSRNRNGLKWNCICDCGNNKVILSSSLLSSRTISCGCFHSSNLTERNLTNNPAKKLDYGMASKNILYANYVRNAKKRNIGFDLDFDTFISITQQPCYLCGKEPCNEMMRKTRRNGSFIYNGIDRIDNTKGYTIDNCRPCCHPCNWSKLDRGYEEYKEWIKQSYNHLFNQEVA